MPAAPNSTALETAALEEVAGLDGVVLAALDLVTLDGVVLEEAGADVPAGVEAGAVVGPAGVDAGPEVAGAEPPVEVEDPPALELGSFPTQLVSVPD